jgi:omega-amidase
MQDLSITLIQSTQFWEDKINNINHLEKLIKKIVKTDIIVLPEMFNTSFSMNKGLAENYHTSSSILWLKSIADFKKCAIYTSLIIELEGKVFNRGVFVYPNGEVITYDKRKLFSLANEQNYFDKGNSSTIVDYLGWKINLQICFDLRFPEISRNRINENGKPNYDLCLFVANWPERRAHHWKSLLIARAIENQAFVIGANRIGVDGNELNYSGDSCVINPMGYHLFDSIPNKELIQQVNLNPKELIEIREKMNFLKDA